MDKKDTCIATYDRMFFKSHIILDMINILTPDDWKSINWTQTKQQNRNLK